MFEKFENIVKNRHENKRRLKGSENKRAIGYLCSYVPEELIYAAGMIPVRVFSSEKTSTRADSIMHSHYCAFSRRILHQRLSGDYGCLDGLVWGYACNTMRFAFEAWQTHGELPFNGFLYVSGLIDTPEAKDHYIGELRRFRRDLKDLVGHAVSDDEVRQAIEVISDS